MPFAILYPIPLCFTISFPIQYPPSWSFIQVFYLSRPSIFLSGQYPHDSTIHDKIGKYIQGLMHSSDLKEVSRLCDHEMLNAILARYGRGCLDAHIAFHADIRSGIIDFIADADITSLFCNLLDNAMEAAGHSPDSFIEISVCKREKTPFIIITMINSSKENPFDKPGGKLATTKSNKHKHGFGIKSIQKIVPLYSPCGKYHIYKSSSRGETATVPLISGVSDKYRKDTRPPSSLR